MLILLSFYQNTRSSSFAKELAARIKGDAVIKAEGDRACKSLPWWIILLYEHLLPSHVECHPCMCMLMLFCFYHVLSGKRWHLRRKVKAGKSQSLQSRRVWTPFIIIIISDSQPVVFRLHPFLSPYECPALPLIHSWRRGRWHVQASEDGRRRRQRRWLLSLWWEGRPLQWRERPVWRRWRGVLNGIFPDSRLVQSKSSLCRGCSVDSVWIVSYPVYGWQGDLFAEVPKPPVSEDKNLLNESLKSTAHAAGNGNARRQRTWRKFTFTEVTDDRKEMLKVEDERWEFITIKQSQSKGWSFDLSVLRMDCVRG